MIKHDQHILNGATLHVSLELLDNAENTSKTIQITGLTAQSTEDSIRNYFENERRSGGGEVEVVTFRPEENMVLVTFKDVEGESLLLACRTGVFFFAFFNQTKISEGRARSAKKVRGQKGKKINASGPREGILLQMLGFLRWMICN